MSDNISKVRDVFETTDTKVVKVALAGGWIILDTVKHSEHIHAGNFTQYLVYHLGWTKDERAFDVVATMKADEEARRAREPAIGWGDV